MSTEQGPTEALRDAGEPILSLKLDLYNFEEPQFEESKYVLSSPRSLEACSRMNVKPVDLLYKPLADFQEELLPQDIPLRTIYNIYDEHEQARQRKLKACRDERNQVIEEENKQGSKPRKGPVVKTGKNIGKFNKLTKKASQREKPHGTTNSGGEVDKCGMQRKRTAWATSVGHRRITNDELNRRAKEIHDESLKLRQELLSRKEIQKTSKKKTQGRSASASMLSTSGTSCLLNKSNIIEAKPIVNPKLRQKLSKSVSRVPVTPTDQKILELMMNKGEEEKETHRERFLAEMAWLENRRQEEEVRLASEMKRRELLAEENRIRDLKKREKDYHLKQTEERLVASRESALEQRLQHWQTMSTQQQRMRDLKMAEKMEKEIARKRIQEENLKTLEQEEREMFESVREQQMHELMTADQRKQSKLLEESMRKIFTNQQEKKYFDVRRKSIEQQSKEDAAALEATLDIRHSQAESNFQQVLQMRDQNIKLNKKDREKRLHHAVKTRTKLEEEMDTWKESVIEHRKKAERHADEAVSRSVEMKARRAQEDRIAKEKGQKKNIKRIQDEVESWKHDTEDLLYSKSRKAQAVLQDKDLTIQQARLIAHTSRQMRNELKEKYGAESFDKKAFKAELFNKITMGHVPVASTNFKSTSNLRLG